MRRGVVGRAAALGHTVSDKGEGRFLSEIASPVERFGVVMGVLAAKSVRLNHFGPEHVLFLEKMAVEMGGRWH
jgi:putative methionine-R-sulfoxide reductase with GAF domain